MQESRQNKASPVILLGVIGYLATQVLAMATVLQQILGGTDMFAGIGLIPSAAISVAVLLFYSVTGGIVASVYTDLVQGAVMAIAGVLVLIAAADVFDGGLETASRILFENDPESILPFGTLGAMASLGWVFLFGFGLAGQPHVVTKMMMNRKLSDNRVILPVTLIGYALSAMLWISIGVVMRALVIGDIEVPLLSADAAAPEFLSRYAHPLLAGVVFAGLFAAIMSTADGFLNIGAAAIVHDMPRALFGRPLNRELFWARLMTVMLTLLATGFALYSYYVDGALVALLGAFGWGTFAAALVPRPVFEIRAFLIGPRKREKSVSQGLGLQMWKMENQMITEFTPPQFALKMLHRIRVLGPGPLMRLPPEAARADLSKADMRRQRRCAPLCGKITCFVIRPNHAVRKRIKAGQCTSFARLPRGPQAPRPVHWLRLKIECRKVHAFGPNRWHLKTCRCINRLTRHRLGFARAPKGRKHGVGLASLGLHLVGLEQKRPGKPPLRDAHFSQRLMQRVFTGAVMRRIGPCGMDRRGPNLFCKARTLHLQSAFRQDQTTAHRSQIFVKRRQTLPKPPFSCATDGPPPALIQDEDRDHRP